MRAPCSSRRAAPRAAAPGRAGGDRGLGLSEGFLRADDPHAGEGGLCAEPVEASALAVINGVRAASGAPGLGCLTRLGAMARAHADYLVQHVGAAGETSTADRHAEVPGEPGFTGADLGARAAFFGLEHQAFWLAEGVGGKGDPADVIAAHLATVYHRSHLLAPGGRYFSYASATAGSQQSVMDTLAFVDIEGLVPVVFPADGAENVPLAFTAAGEIPDPAPAVATKGFPISVHFPRYLRSSDAQEPTVMREGGVFTLFDVTHGVPVAEVLVIEPRTDPVLARSDIFLLPKAPLLPMTQYEARARVRYGAFSIDRRWRFRSGQ